MNSVERVRTAIKLGTLATLLLAPLAALSAPTKAPAKPDPNFIASPAELKARIPSQLHITKPDFVVFVPEVTNDSVNDTGNEQVMVFDGPDGSLMAVWTQSSVENFRPETPPDQHIVFSQSLDEGKTWSKPRVIAGPSRAGEGHMASWAFPLVSRSGRIYVIYSQSIGKNDTWQHVTARMDGIVSDDQGKTWSKPQTIPMPRTCRDNPDTSYPGNWLCWQKPLRLTKDGKYFAGITRWTSTAVKKNPTKSWTSHDSVVEFMRFDNLDDNPEVAQIKISWFAFDKDAITVPFPGHPEVSACQEPSIVKLPDGRLFCVMRTSAGSPFWTVSSDDGKTWTPARRLLRKDGGEPLLHPLSPCPIYDVGGNEAGSGRYALFIHNHDGNYKGDNPIQTGFHRRPVCLVPGHFQAGADQPVWFGEPQLFMDHDGVSLGKPGTAGRLDLSLYSSFTVRNGKPVLWYPDRKFFLLGRNLGSEQTEPVSTKDAGIRLGDVLMRSMRVWPRGENDQRDTLETAKAFKVDRILWIYENTPEFNAKVHAAGIGIGTTISPNARAIWQQSLPPQEIHRLIDRFTIRNLDGEQVILEHTKRFGKNAKNAFVSYFQPDQTNPQWMEYYVDYVAMLYKTGVDAIHRDTAAICSSAPRSGGTFTDSALEYFRRYLASHFTADQLATMGVTNVATFNAREHFKALGAPVDTTLWQWRGSPLMSVYLDAMRQADRDFFLGVRAAVEKRTGRRIPWSLNTTGPVKPHEDAFDFRIGEFQSHLNQPQTMLQISELSRRCGKPQALQSMVDRNWRTLPTFVSELRRHIATAYAIGMIPLVPWDMYMHDAPRYYGTVEDYGDLFRFVSDNRSRFDDHRLASVSGMDTIAKLYSWLPNKELVFEGGNASARVWLNQANVFAFLRQKSGAKGAVMHLVDWNPKPKPIDITFNPKQVIGVETAKLTFLRPGKKPFVISSYLGETIILPEISPWGVVVVEPAVTVEKSLSPPEILAPVRAVIPTGTVVRFHRPGTGKVILARHVPDDSAAEVKFVPVTGSNAIPIARSGTIEAFLSDDTTGAKSKPIRVRVNTFQDFAVSEKTINASQRVTDLTERFICKDGEMRVNASFLATEMRLMGKKVERGISTKGDTTLSAGLDPAWRFFTVRAGIDDSEDRRPCARLQVLFDNRLAYETPIINPTKQQLADEERRVFPIALRIPTGARAVHLRVVNCGFFEEQNTVIWAEPSGFEE